MHSNEFGNVSSEEQQNFLHKLRARFVKINSEKLIHGHQDRVFEFVRNIATDLFDLLQKMNKTSSERASWPKWFIKRG